MTDHSASTKGKRILCIFCDKVLGPDTKPEHILGNALGGRKTTRLAICSKHNNAFGGDIDDSLAESVSLIRNYLQLRSGSGDDAPALKQVQAGSDRINIAGDGNISLAGKPFTVEKLPDGNFSLEINANSEEHLQKLIPNIAASMGISEDDLKQQLALANVRQVAKRPDGFWKQLSLGSDDSLRSIAKSLLVLCSIKIGTEELRKDRFAAIRQFVLCNERLAPECLSMDSRPFPVGPALEERFGPIFNLMLVKSDANGRLIGYFRLYNVIAWRFVLAESGVPPNQSISLLSNPLEPRIWSDDQKLATDVSFEWLDTPVNDGAAVVERMNVFGRLHRIKGMEQEIGRISDEVFALHGFTGNDAVPIALASSIWAGIQDRLVTLLSNQAHERQLTPEEVAKHLKDRTKDTND